METKTVYHIIHYDEEDPKVYFCRGSLGEDVLQCCLPKNLFYQPLIVKDIVQIWEDDEIAVKDIDVWPRSACEPYPEYVLVNVFRDCDKDDVFKNIVWSYYVKKADFDKIPEEWQQQLRDWQTNENFLSHTSNRPLHELLLCLLGIPEDAEWSPVTDFDRNHPCHQLLDENNGEVGQALPEDDIIVLVDELWVYCV